jgi:hypothetical protein
MVVFRMTALNGPHAFWLVFIATVMGMLGLHRWRSARGTALSRVAFCYMVFSFAMAGVISVLIVMDRAGFGSAVGPVVELLSKVEAGLAC